MLSIRSKLANTSWVLAVLSVFLLMPVLIIIFKGFNLSYNSFLDTFGGVLAKYIFNTAYLIALVAVFSLCIAVVSAFFLARYDFAFKKFFIFVLILPLAVPAYILGFAYVMLFEYQGVLHQLFNYSANILNIYWAAAVLSLSLFPYLFSMLRVVFLNILANMAEETTNLKISERKLFFYALLPMSKFTIFFALGLIVMESLNEYGLVAYYGVETITLTVFKALYGFYNLNLAVFISSVIVIIIFMVIFAGKGFSNSNAIKFKLNNKAVYASIKPKKGLLVFIYIWLTSIFLLSLGVPMLVLLYKASFYLNLINLTTMHYLFNSISLSLAVALCSVIIAFIIVYIKRFNKGLNSFLARLPVLGYAVPGAIIALGVLILLQYLGTSFKALPFVGFGVLIYAYLVRFVFVPINSIENIYSKYSNLEESITSLKKRDISTIFSIDLYIVHKALKLGFLLVFLDSMKELPMALLLRPLQFETITIKTWYLANNEMLSETSVYALMLIFCSGIVVWLFNR